MDGLNTSSGSMTYAFSTPQLGVGGTINDVPGGGTPTISVYDMSNTLIESTVRSFSTSSPGEFHGFLESTPSISSFTLSNASIGLRDFTVQPAPTAVPEIDPAGMGSVLALVAGALCLLERRRLKAA